MDNLIRWDRSDTQKLSRAVRRYNDIAEQSSAANLPQIDYKTLKSEILTRKELNRQIEKLNRLTLENANHWGEEELKRDIKLAESRLKNDLKGLEEGEYMGNIQYQYVAGELNNIRRLKHLPASFREKKIARIKNLASRDYDMKVANNYRNWYIATIEEKYSGFDGYKKLMKKLKSVKNPEKFYNSIKDFINEADIYLLRYSLVNQEFFNRILKAWGIEEEDESEIYS